MIFFPELKNFRYNDRTFYTYKRKEQCKIQKDDVLYAPVEWVDHSEGYTDIRFHKSTDGIAKSRLTVRKCVMHFVRKQSKK